MSKLSKLLCFTLSIIIIFSSSLKVVFASDTNGAYDFVTRLYEVTLERSPDQSGLHAWGDKLINGDNTGVATAYGFIMSPEFQNKGYSNNQYIDLMYQAFFGRTADSMGKAAWVAQLDNGVSKEEIFAGFANSQEFYNLCKSYGVVAGTYIIGCDIDQTADVNLFIQRLYSVVLHRDCDISGMQNWTNQLMSGKETGAGAAYGFFFSNEYRNQNKSDSYFIKDLYNALMGREPDELGFYSWCSVINGGATDREIFNGFTMSDEFRSICGSYGINVGGMITDGNESARIDRQKANSDMNNVNSGNNNSSSGSIVQTSDDTYPTDNTFDSNDDYYENYISSLPVCATITTTGMKDISFQKIDEYHHYSSDQMRTPVNPLDYTYEVYPLLGDFNEFFYIKTDNPDPWSFRLYDPESVYYQDGEVNKYISVVTNLYPDVLYENPDTYRVHGGYIATSNRMSNGDGVLPYNGHCVDGGNLILQVAREYHFIINRYDDSDGTTEEYFNCCYAQYEDTDVIISSSRFIDEADYLINNYTNPNNSLFENLDNIQAAINNLSVYPRGLLDDTSGYLYNPYWAASPYYELSLNKHTNIYPSTWGQELLEYVYPYVLSSLGVPAVIDEAAVRLNPRAYSTQGAYHSETVIHLGSESKVYGGAGSGTPDSVYLSQINTDFKFDGSLGDYFTNGSIERYRTELLHYSELGRTNSSEASSNLGTITSQSGWVIVAHEHMLGTSTGHYAYIAVGIPGYMYFSLENIWVDGRYVNINNVYEPITFEESLERNPDIYLEEVSYVNQRGNQVTGNFIYKYIKDQNIWVATQMIPLLGIRNYSDYSVLPDEAVLTRSEVDMLNIDRNYNINPQHGRIYDGTAVPGTPF